MFRYTRNTIGEALLSRLDKYHKKVPTLATRIAGPFTVETREGVLKCPDGYLAIDAHGWPYPIAKDEFEAIYERLAGRSD